MDRRGRWDPSPWPAHRQAAVQGGECSAAIAQTPPEEIPMTGAEHLRTLEDLQQSNEACLPVPRLPLRVAARGSALRRGLVPHGEAADRWGGAWYHAISTDLECGVAKGLRKLLRLGSRAPCREGHSRRWSRAMTNPNRGVATALQAISGDRPRNTGR